LETVTTMEMMETRQSFYASSQGNVQIPFTRRQDLSRQIERRLSNRKLPECDVLPCPDRCPRNEEELLNEFLETLKDATHDVLTSTQTVVKTPKTIGITITQVFHIIVSHT